MTGMAMMTNDPPALPSPEPDPEAAGTAGVPSVSAATEAPPAEGGAGCISSAAASSAPGAGTERGEGAGSSETPAGDAAPSSPGLHRPWPVIGVLLLVAAIGAAGGILLWREHAADEEALGALRREVGLLRTEREKPPSSAPVAAEAMERLAALERRLGALEAAQSPQAGTAAPAGGGEAVRAALAERDARITALEKEISALREQLAGLSGEVALLEARGRLARNLEEGRPLGTDLALPPPLARFATTPPPTLPELARALDKAARAEAAVRHPDGEAAGEGAVAGLRRAVAEAERLFAAAFTVRHGGAVVWGDPVAAETQRAREALGRGDLAAAVDAVAHIEGPAASFFTAWLEQARALLAARTALLSLGEGA